MSSSYAIELSLMLYQDGESGQWVRSFTYYNHGLEPPYGGVKSDETTVPIVMSIDDLRANIKSIESFIKHIINVVKTIKPVPKNAIPDSPLELSVTPQENTLDYVIEMESMQLTVIYDKATKEITFKPRSSYDVSWQGFLFYHETMEDFLAEIERQ